MSSWALGVTVAYSAARSSALGSPSISSASASFTGISDRGHRLRAEPRRAGGVAGPPGTTAGGLAGLLRAEPSRPAGSVRVMYAASSAATWARAQPRISGGAAGEVVAHGLVELVDVLG